MTGLDELVASASASLAEELAREQRSLSPDFAAVVEEAHARDPRRVPARALAEVRALAPVVDLRSDAPRREQPEFAALLAATRAEIEADTAAAALAGPPGVPVPKARKTAGRAWMWLAAAAAIAALASGLRPLLGQGGASGDAALQAPWQEQAAPSRHEATPAPTPVNAAGPAAGSAPAEEPALMPAAEEPAVMPAAEEPAPVEAREAVEKEMSERTDKSQRGAREEARPRAESPGERLRRLDREAEAKWQAGDLAGAEALYREIVAAAPGGKAADLAYGDLFSLARQRHGADHEVALWREYLQRFPRGRYADDARAGLCRRADEQVREACWRAYLGDFPAGVHRHQAAAALEAGR